MHLARAEVKDSNGRQTVFINVETKVKAVSFTWKNIKENKEVIHPVRVAHLQIYSKKIQMELK